ncbi:MAG: CorA family divalent cation transporter [Gammaproteobacteria bacterium]
MLVIHCMTNGQIERLDAIPADSREQLWLDLTAPTREDRERVEQALGLRLPAMSDLGEIEATSRFFVDDIGIHLRASFFDTRNGELDVQSVGFILAKGCLISIRPLELETFATLRALRQLGVDKGSPFAVLLRLVELELDAIADRMEDVYARVEAHGPATERVTHEYLEDDLVHVSGLEAVNGKVRFALMDFDLVLAALNRERKIPAELERRFDELRRDVDSLLNHCAFISDKLDFLVGMVMTRLTLVDNRVGKILSVVALIFLPPTLIGSIYGMNFHHMPELAQPWAYPAALAAMGVSAVLPYLIFKWKRWL